MDASIEGVLNISKEIISNWKRKVIKMYGNMIEPLQKGINKAKIEIPAIGKYEGIDLSKLPSFICYKAALIKEKVLWQNLAVGLFIALSLLYVVDRHEINKLSKLYREKEYIVLPDHIPVSPHSISDDYVKDAADTFLSLLGSINAKEIEKQYQRLASNMTIDFRRKFEEEMFDWKEYVIAENITEILQCGKQEIYSDDKGGYDVTALCKKETYINHEYIGAVDEVVEMELRAIAPNKTKRWVLTISNIKRTTKKTFKVKKKL